MILFFPFDLLSHNLRCLQLAKAIKDHHEVRIAFSDNYNHFFKEAGIETFYCPGIPAGPVMEAAKKFNFSWMNEHILEAAFLRQVKAIQKYKPEAVVGDASFTLRLAAAYTKTPYISIINGYMSRYYARTRRLPDVHPAAQFRKKVPETIFNRIIRFAEGTVHKQVHRPFRKLAKKYRVLSKNSFLEELEGNHTFIADLPELFPQKHLPNSFSIIGPLYHKSGGPETELLHFLDNGRKNILVSMGSTGTSIDLSFLAGNLFRQFNIVSTSPLPEAENIFYKPFIHTASVIEKMDILICHGGNGTIYQALSAGLPVLCAPSIFEQEWNLQGLEALGLGERLHGTETEALDQVKKWINRENKKVNTYTHQAEKVFREKVNMVIT